MIILSLSVLQTRWFFADCQQAVTDWGKIVLATGGYLKAKKCFWYMMAWHWVKG